MHRSGAKLTLQPGPRTRPAVFAGPFLIELADVRQFAASGTGRLSLQFRADGLPAAIADRLREVIEEVEIEDVLDASGRDLHDAASGGGETWPERAPRFEKELPLKGLLRDAEVIQTLRGRITLKLPTRVETMRFEPPTPGMTQTRGTARVTLQRVSAGGSCTLSFALHEIDESTLVVVPRDAQGQVIRQIGSVGSGNVRDIVLMQRPARVDVSFVAATQNLDYAFELRDIPLPAHAEMPQTLSPARFPGHDEPATVQFLEIVERGSFPKVRLRVVNHADKAIRRMDVSFVYRGADGEPVKEFPHGLRPVAELNRETPAVLVGPGTHSELVETAFFMPDQTRSLTVAVRSVEFADATHWPTADTEHD